MNRTRAFGVTVLLSLALAAPAAAQAPWDGTMLLAPGSPEGLGIFLSDPGAGGFAVMGMMRKSPAPVGFGVRVAVGEDGADDIFVSGGVDLAGNLLTPTAELPIGVIWLFGAGASIGNEVLAAFPVGLSVGADLQTQGILFRPYVAPRAALDVWSGTGDHIDLSLALDLGLDLSFDPDWAIRFGASFGDRDAITIGFTTARLHM